MAAHEASGGRKAHLPVSVQLEGVEASEHTPPLAAYVFSQGGKLIARQDIDAKTGAASLPMPAVQEATAARVVVGPRLAEKDFESSSQLLAELVRRGAVERHLRLDAKAALEKVQFPIFPEIWRCWLLGLCLVRGKLLKRINRDGIPVDFPVCHAEVKIYEVDAWPIIIDRIPPFVLADLRRAILDIGQPIPVGPVPPIPDPGPRRDAVIGPMFTAAGSATAARAAGETGHELAHDHDHGAAAASAGGENMAATAMDMTSALRSAIDPTLQFRARTASDFEFRRLIIDYVDIFRPWLCFYYPWLWVKRLVATAHTDDCGHFSAWVFRGCDADKPDYYFTADQKFLGWFTITIYAPTPVPCYTFWNYQCGTEVTLYTTHPLARTCSPCDPVVAPDNWVLVTGFGPTSLAEVRGASAALAPTTDASNMGFLSDGRPFGGLLRLRIEFDNALRDNLNIKYYRVSYRPGTSGPFSVLDGTIVRHYAHVVGTQLVSDVYKLGPNTVGGQPALFEIPPAVPPLGQWSTPDPIEDWTSSKFPTADIMASLPAGSKTGLYQLKIDLFTATGALVNIDGANKIHYVVPDVIDLTGTVTTDSADLLGLVQDDNFDADTLRSFLLNVYVDNDRCTGVVGAPNLDGAPADLHCGIIAYTGNTPSGTVNMPFQASHPHGFANYSFAVKRSTTTVLSTGGPVGAGSFTESMAAVDMMDGCPAAAFAENLYVAATATDGWSRLSGYDASDFRAFAIAPKLPGM